MRIGADGSVHRFHKKVLTCCPELRNGRSATSDTDIIRSSNITLHCTKKHFSHSCATVKKSGKSSLISEWRLLGLDGGGDNSSAWGRGGDLLNPDVTCYIASTAWGATLKSGHFEGHKLRSSSYSSECSNGTINTRIAQLSSVSNLVYGQIRSESVNIFMIMRSVAGKFWFGAIIASLRMINCPMLFRSIAARNIALPFLYLFAFGIMEVRFINLWNISAFNSAAVVPSFF